MKGRKLKEAGFKTNICFDCKKADGRCSWSEVIHETGEIRFQPPEGAVYEKIPYKLWRETDTTMHIKQCPLFDPDEGYNPKKAKAYTVIRRVDRGAIIAAFDMGLTNRDIAKKLGVGTEAVSYWKKKLIREGVLSG